VLRRGIHCALLRLSAASSLQKIRKWSHEKIVILDCASFGGLQSGAQEQLDPLRHGGEAFVVGQALVIAIVDLLDDDGDFETGKHQVESHVGNVAARFLRVTLYELGARQAARVGRRSPTRFEDFRRIASIDPIG
jgi:hypothetical protein